MAKHHVKTGILVSLFGLLALPGAHAEIVKCRSASGETIYTQNTCPAGSVRQDMPQEVAKPAASKMIATLYDCQKPDGKFMVRSTPCVAGEKTVKVHEFKEPERLKGLSPRAQQLDNDLELLGRVQLACADESKADTPDCRALLEWRRAMFKDFKDDAGRRQPMAREECAEGNEKACEIAACPLDLYAQSANKVRGCARDRNFPSTPQWAQVEGRGTGNYQQATVVCLTKVENELMGSIYRDITVEHGSHDGRPPTDFRIRVDDNPEVRGK